MHNNDVNDVFHRKGGAEKVVGYTKDQQKEDEEVRGLVSVEGCILTDQNGLCEDVKNSQKKTLKDVENDGTMNIAKDKASAKE